MNNRQKAAVIFATTTLGAIAGYLVQRHLKEEARKKARQALIRYRGDDEVVYGYDDAVARAIAKIQAQREAGVPEHEIQDGVRAFGPMPQTISSVDCTSEVQDPIFGETTPENGSQDVSEASEEGDGDGPKTPKGGNKPPWVDQAAEMYENLENKAENSRGEDSNAELQKERPWSDDQSSIVMEDVRVTEAEMYPYHSISGGEQPELREDPRPDLPQESDEYREADLPDVKPWPTEKDGKYFQISEDKYRHEEPWFDKMTATYFTVDRVLAGWDEHLEPLKNEEELLRRCFTLASAGENAGYFRHLDDERDVEVVFSDVTYAEAKAGA